MAGIDRDIPGNDRDIPGIDRDIPAIDRDMASTSENLSLAQLLSHNVSSNSVEALISVQKWQAAMLTLMLRQVLSKNVLHHILIAVQPAQWHNQGSKWHVAKCLWMRGMHARVLASAHWRSDRMECKRCSNAFTSRIGFKHSCRERPASGGSSLGSHPPRSFFAGRGGASTSGSRFAGSHATCSSLMIRGCGWHISCCRVLMDDQLLDP